MSFTFTRHTVKHRAAILTKKQLLHVTLVAGTTRDPERNQLILSMSHALGLRVTELSRITVADILHPKGRIRGELALSEVRRIGEKLDDEHPMRYIVRNMKRTAESIISDAMRQATDISNQAAQLVKDYDESLKPQ